MHTQSCCSDPLFKKEEEKIDFLPGEVIVDRACKHQKLVDEEAARAFMSAGKVPCEWRRFHILIADEQAIKTTEDGEIVRMPCMVFEGLTWKIITQVVSSKNNGNIYFSRETRVLICKS